MERQYYFIIAINVIVLSIIVTVLVAEAHNTPKTVDRHADIVNRKPRSVWSDKDWLDGDRIGEQMVYVPNGYRGEKAPIKRILIYTGVDANRKQPKLDHEEFVGCPVSRCSLTANTSYGPEVDAVLFSHTDTRPEFKRPPNQIWILSHTGAAPSGTDALTDADAFNWTATYRRDSDLPRPYAYFRPDFRGDAHTEPPTVGRDYAANKSRQVAWFVPESDGQSNRTAYALELAQHISVDVPDGCGPSKRVSGGVARNQCFRTLKDDYKFYLAFEDAHCQHYVTELLFDNALGHDVLPIVMGPRRSDYELVAPKGSFIHVDDFESPKLLAEYLKKLDANDELYNEYFRWKGTGKIVSDTKYYCRLCALLHDEGHSPKHYEDINEWLNGPGVCEPGSHR